VLFYVFLRTIFFVFTEFAHILQSHCSVLLFDHLNEFYCIILASDLWFYYVNFDFWQLLRYFASAEVFLCSSIINLCVFALLLLNL